MEIAVILSLPAFTLVHVLLSLVGLIAGLVVVGGLASGRRLEGWTAVFLVATILANATGFGFPFNRLLPSHVVGGISLLLLPLVALARYGRHLRGGWNRVFVLGLCTGLYLNMFVLVAQLFAKIPLLIVLAPNQQSPVFGVTQLFVLVLFVLLGRSAVRGAPAPGPAVSPGRLGLAEPGRVASLGLVLVLAGALTPAEAMAQAMTWSSAFEMREIPTNGTTLHVRVGGTGPAVVLLHGYGDTGDMWIPLAEQLVDRYRVVVVDLRGLGLSAPAERGFEKKNQADDITGVMDALGIDRAAVVAHDIGNMVAFAVAAWHGDRVTRLVLMDAPVPGVGPWDEVLKNPILWHFRFGGPDMERLVAGRERIYLDRFWNEFSAQPARFTEGERAHYAALYARPGAMHAGFAQFAAFDQDAIDNRAWLASGRLAMPVLAVGGEKSFGTMMAYVTRFAADTVRQAVIPDAGHWLMEEQPEATSAIITAFLADGGVPLRPVALTRTAVDAAPRLGAGTGTSGVRGIATTLLAGDPARPGPYTIAIRVPPHTSIAAHTHRDDRVCTVVEGDWYYGFGAEAGAARATRLTAGAFYTEPAGVAHFAFTRDKGATVYISGVGPSSTAYLTATH